MSMSAGATLRSPVSTTGLRCCKPCRYAANSARNSFVEGKTGHMRVQDMEGREHVLMPQ